MEHTRKMTVIPTESESIEVANTTALAPKKKQLNPMERMFKILKIVLKLAQVSGYDNEGRIRSKKGGFVENSNIINLLYYCMNPGRLLVGEEDFIHLLKKANINPDLITNENIKQKLRILEVAEEAVEEPTIVTTEVPSRKRTVFESEIVEPQPKKRRLEPGDEIDWEIPSDEPSVPPLRLKRKRPDEWEIQ